MGALPGWLSGWLVSLTEFLGHGCAFFGMGFDHMPPVHERGSATCRTTDEAACLHVYGRAGHTPTATLTGSIALELAHTLDSSLGSPADPGGMLPGAPFNAHPGQQTGRSSGNTGGQGGGSGGTLSSTMAASIAAKPVGMRLTPHGSAPGLAGMHGAGSEAAGAAAMMPGAAGMAQPILFGVKPVAPFAPGASTAGSQGTRQGTGTGSHATATGVSSSAASSGFLGGDSGGSTAQQQQQGSGGAVVAGLSGGSDARSSVAGQSESQPMVFVMDGCPWVLGSKLGEGAYGKVRRGGTGDIGGAGAERLWLPLA